MERALAAARRALDIDDSLAEAHASLGFALEHLNHDWAHAEAEYRRAIDLSPGYATALQWLALCLAAEGRFDEAIATSRRAVAADPLSPIIATDLGRHLYYARRYPQAIEQLRAAVDLDPTFTRAHQELGRALRQGGLLDVALSELSRAVALSDRSSAAVAELASARAAAGDRAGAEELLTELSRRRASGTYVSGYHFAVVATALGDRERAVRELWSAYQDRFNWIVFVGVEPQFDTLRGADGFEHLVHSLEIPSGSRGSERPEAVDRRSLAGQGVGRLLLRRGAGPLGSGDGELRDSDSRLHGAGTISAPSSARPTVLSVFARPSAGESLAGWGRGRNPRSAMTS